MNTLCQVEFNANFKSFEKLMKVIIHINRIKKNTTRSSW